MHETIFENVMKNVDVSLFQNDLIQWFRQEKRDLPWRQDQDPYKVWVSEIMLQQTKVDTVIPYFNNFIKKFPTMRDLATANEQEVLKAWEGLGYYSRARNLQSAVQEVVATYHSKVPDNPKELSSLKGVGPYTTGAILSIAYDIPEPAVDGNVMRVLSRILLIDVDITKQSARKLFEKCVKALISEDNPSDFNQGLMELGALVCTPKSPSCMLCPVQSHCRAFRLGAQEQLPIKTKAKKQKELQYYAFLLKDNQGNFLIEQRPDTGLLANLWQFPMVEKNNQTSEQLEQFYADEYGLQVKLNATIDSIKHVFSHVIWQLTVVEGEILNDFPSNEKSVLVSNEELAEYPLPVSHQKIVKHI